MDSNRDPEPESGPDVPPPDATDGSEDSAGDDEPDSVEEVYSQLNADISEEEFRERVEAKVEQMGGLCDEDTAAKLIAHEIGDQKEVYKIEEITPEEREVKFVGQIMKTEETRTFEKDDGGEGKVTNIVVADETGSVRVSLWDEYADSAEDLDEGDTLRISGNPKDGYKDSVEVSASKVEIDEDVEIDITEGSSGIDEVYSGMSDISLEGEVLDVSEMRTFDRDDDSEGRVSNITIGDDTGWIRVTLWDDRAPEAKEFDVGDSVRIFNGYAKESEGDIEIHVGNRGSVKEIDDQVEFSPETTPIEDVEMDETYDISGVVTESEEKRTFTRDDGTEGQVKNVRVRDETGELRVALWGEKADTDVVPGEKILMTNVQIKEGWNGGVEGSLNWRSFVVTEGSASEDVDDSEDENEGLESFM